MVVGIFFVILCGFDLAYTVIMLAPSESDDPELEGHSVKFNQTGALIPVVSQLNSYLRFSINHKNFI